MGMLVYPKFYRQRLVLFFLKQAGGSLSKINFQKLLFLMHQEMGLNYYSFVPYHYGCYSFQAASDLSSLQSRGWLELGDKDILLSGQLPVENGLVTEESTKIVQFMRDNKGWRSRELVRYVYENYPYYAIKSKIAKDVLSKDELKNIDQERQKLPNKESVLFTIGYEGIKFEEYVNILIKNDIQLLCDVRKNPISRKFGFSKGSLSTVLPKLGIKYLHIPELGIVSYKRKQLETEKDYKKLFVEYEKSLSQKETYLNDLKKLIDAHRRIALTCFEKSPDSCHRHCISDYLERSKDIKVVHL